MAIRKNYYLWEDLFKKWWDGSDEYTDFIQQEFGLSSEQASELMGAIHDYGTPGKPIYNLLGEDDEVIYDVIRTMDSEFYHNKAYWEDAWKTRYWEQWMGESYTPKYTPEQQQQGIDYFKPSYDKDIQFEYGCKHYIPGSGYGKELGLFYPTHKRPPSYKLNEELERIGTTLIEQPEIEKKINTEAAHKASEKAIYVNGIRYDSYNDAAKATGLSRMTLNRALDDGKIHKGYIITSKGE